MATNPVSTQMPTQTAFVDSDGRLTKTAIYFLLSLMNRTGGVPGIPIEILVGEVQVLQVEVANDTPLPPAAPTIPAGAFMTDEPPPPPLNPYLAALLMQDIS